MLLYLFSFCGCETIYTGVHRLTIIILFTLDKNKKHNNNNKNTKKIHRLVVYKNRFTNTSISYFKTETSLSLYKANYYMQSVVTSISI